MTLTHWTLLCTVAGAVVIILLERIIPQAKQQKLLRGGFVNDLVWYTFVQSYVLGILIYGIIGAVDQASSISRWNALRELPIWLQCMIVFIAHDFYIYWFHRWQHHHPGLWRIHEAHHSTLEVDWLSGSRSHPLEILINQTLEYAPILLFASPEVAPIKGALDAVWGMYIHANINVRSGLLQYVFNGPEMHRWHHASDERAHNRNFATKLAAWDWIFGTAYRPPIESPSSFGLGPQEFPSSYFKQIAYAFRRDDPSDT